MDALPAEVSRCLGVNGCVGQRREVDVRVAAELPDQVKRASSAGLVRREGDAMRNEEKVGSRIHDAVKNMGDAATGGDPTRWPSRPRGNCSTSAVSMTEKCQSG